MDLKIDGEKICLLTDENKKMLSKFVEESGDIDLVQSVYVITVTAFMAGLKYAKEKDHE